jgi:3-dehydroquinate dehydratase
MIYKTDVIFFVVTRMIMGQMIRVSFTSYETALEHALKLENYTLIDMHASNVENTSSISSTISTTKNGQIRMVHKHYLDVINSWNKAV